MCRKSCHSCPINITSDEGEYADNTGCLPRIDNLRTLSLVWEKLADNWDKLTEMLEEQLQTKKANGMYELMKQIGC